MRPLDLECPLLELMLHLPLAFTPPFYDKGLRSIIEVFPISFLRAFSLNRASLTMLMVNFSFGAELLGETTNGSNLSGIELRSRRASISSLNFSVTLFS